ncbi:MAG: hypothetical protein HQL76_16335 [Magnetococcales bacterium]|nr:hypothetical protein [Magnetococcales bacterium]
MSDYSFHVLAVYLLALTVYGGLILRWHLKARHIQSQIESHPPLPHNP